MTVDNNDTDGDGTPDATDTDDDNDGLTDVQEGTLGTNPLLADTDGDGANDGTEVNTNLTNPLKYNYSTITVAGDFQGWSPAPNPTNTMTKVTGQEFGWTLNYRFNSLTNTPGKFTAGGWTTSWGTNASTAASGKLVLGGDNINFNVTSTGFWTFAFNTDTLDFSFARTVFANYAAYATAYALTGDESADQDNDGITNGAEFTANTDPTRANDATPPVITITGNALVAVALNGSYTDAGATATDNVDSSVTVNSSGTVDTAVAGTYTITYSATDAAGNTAVNRTRTVLVYDPAAGFASQYNSIAVPGNFNGWTTDGSAGNALKKMANFTWHGIKYFTTNNATGGFKFLANGAWSYEVVTNGVTNTIGNKQWAPAPLLTDGSGNSSLAANVTTNGWYLFAVTETNDTASVSRLTVTPQSDEDNDGIPDVLEAYFGSFRDPAISDLDPTADYNNNQKTALQDYQEGINPTQDTIAPTLAFTNGVAKLTWLALNSNSGQYLGNVNEVTAASEVPGEVPLLTVIHRLMSGSEPGVRDAVDTTVAGLWQIEYTASDDFGNSSTVTRVVVVGDQAPTYYSLHFPASATISTMGSQGVYAQIYINNATPGAGAAPNIKAWIGVNTNNTDPATWDSAAWTEAPYNAGQTGNNDEYGLNLSGATLGAGTYYYASRWQVGSGAYFYGGIDSNGNGNAWNSASHTNGVLTVNAAVAREVTFAVDMGVQAFRGAFTPGTDSVYLVGDVSDWTTGVAMTREGSTSVYKVTIPVEGAENVTRNYKFRSSVGGFEGDLDPGIPGDTTRVLTLGAANVAQNLSTAIFNNQTEARKVTFRVDMSVQQQLGNFNSSTGTVKVAGSFNGWTGVALTAQGNGVYAGEVVIDGSISGVAYKFLANDAYESLAGDRSLPTDLLNLTTTTLAPVYFSDVSQAGSTFAGWAGGATLDATNVGKYAIGGASSPTATDGVKPTSTVSGGNLVLTAIVRTDDAKLTVVGEAVTSLANYASGTSVTEVTGSASGIDQTGVPAGHQKQAFSVPQNTDNRKFLRIKATLAP